MILNENVCGMIGMDKNIILSIKAYLKSEGIADIDGEKSKMDFRGEGKK